MNQDSQIIHMYITVIELIIIRYIGVRKSKEAIT